MTTNLERAGLTGASLEEAYMERANLKGAFMPRVNLEGAFLRLARLTDAHLKDASLKGAKDYTIKQLAQAAALEGATMPDGTKLRGDDNPAGPTFEEWAKSQNQVDWQTGETEIESVLRSEEEE